MATFLCVSFKGVKQTVSWASRFKLDSASNPGLLPAVAITTVLMAAGMWWLWSTPVDSQHTMDRYGDSLADTLATASAGPLMHDNIIELAVVAARTVALPEVAGVVFYDAQREVVASNGSVDLHAEYPGTAMLEETITGYVSVYLHAERFVPPVSAARWWLTLLLCLLAPAAAMLGVSLASRTKESLPIVSVPESNLPCSSYCLTFILHNQMSLDRPMRTTAIQDALDMTLEASALHQGMRLEVTGRGVIVLFDTKHVSPQRVLATAFLTLRLLSDIDSPGHFRVFANTVTCPGSPSERSHFDWEELSEIDVDALMTLASLAKPDSVLLCGSVLSQSSDDIRSCAELFKHPLAEDLTDKTLHHMAQPAPEEQQWINDQANLILGFTRATA